MTTRSGSSQHRSLSEHTRDQGQCHGLLRRIAVYLLSSEERHRPRQAIWTFATRANVAFQLLGGALLVALVDLVFMVRARFGYAVWPATAPWPRWTLIAIPAGVTLLWLILATVIVATYRQWQRQSSPQQMDTETQPEPGYRRP